MPIINFQGGRSRSVVGLFSAKYSSAEATVLSKPAMLPMIMENLMGAYAHCPSLLPSSDCVGTMLYIWAHVSYTLLPSTTSLQGDPKGQLEAQAADRRYHGGGNEMEGNHFKKQCY